MKLPGNPQAWFASFGGLVAGFALVVAFNADLAGGRTIELELHQLNVSETGVVISVAWHYEGKIEDDAVYTLRVVRGGEVLSEREWTHNAGGDAKGHGAAGMGFPIDRNATVSKFVWTATGRWEGSSRILARIEGWFEAPCSRREGCAADPEPQFR